MDRSAVVPLGVAVGHDEQRYGPRKQVSSDGFRNINREGMEVMR